MVGNEAVGELGETANPRAGRLESSKSQVRPSWSLVLGPQGLYQAANEGA